MRVAILGFTISACLVLGGARAQTPDDKRRTFRVPQNPLGALTEHDDIPGASKSISFDRGTVSVDLVADPLDGQRQMDLLIEGRDNFQKPWQVRTRYEGGLGFAEGWQADLDANGTLDLILVNAFPFNGWCVDRKRLIIVLIDGEGVPVPWEMETVFDVDFDSGGVLELLDLNKNGRAEFVQVDCDLGNYEVAAVYEAAGAKWQRLGGDQAAPMLSEYLNVAGKGRDLRLASDRERSDANHPNASASELWRTIDKFVPAERRPPVVVPPIRDGRLIEGEELEDWRRNEYAATLNRWFLSDGTECHDVPSIVVNGPKGRLVVMEYNAALKLLQEIVQRKWLVALSGNRHLDDCSPAWLWVKGE